MRKDTYILFNADNNEFKQVGKSCLKDFLGHQSPEQIASYAEYLIELNSEDWSDVGFGIAPKHAEIINWLAITKEIVDKYGYVSSKKRAELDEQGIKVLTTTQEVLDQVYPSTRTYQMLVEKDRWVGEPSEKAIEFATRTVEHIKSMDAQNEYEKNLLVLASSDEYFSLDMAGYVTSMIPFYTRQIEQITAREKAIEEKKDSEYIGNVGDKIELKLKVDKVHSFETMWGVTKIHLMSDAEGNQLVWKTTSACLEEGKEMAIKGTVKKHGEYNGIRQTELTRCKVL